MSKGSVVIEVAGSTKSEREKLLDTAKKRHKIATAADQTQRERERKCLKFQDPDQQWDDDAKAQRGGNPAAGIPARPILSIPKIDQPVQLILNQERSAHLGVNIQPASPDATTEVAEFFEGHYREIERDSEAHDARGWAFERAVKVGRGYYRINTVYDDSLSFDGDTTPAHFDQKIAIERILDQSCVHFDPAAQKVDNSDAEYVFVDRWITPEDFRRNYPKATDPSKSDEFADEAEDAPDWVKGEDDKEAVLVVEYFWKEHTTEEISLEVEGEPPLVRKRDKVTVRWATLSGVEVIEEQEWNGKYLPIVTVLGKELQPFDGQRRYQGVIEPAMGAQKIHNYAASQAVESAALEPKAPYIMAEGQQEGFEEQWKYANVRNYPYLLYKPTTLAGSPLPAPQRNQVDGSRMNLSMQLLTLADNFIQSATATYDPALGRTSPREKSGRAILALQEQSELGSSHYLSNLARAMQYEARVVLDLIPAIYDRPGRVARTLDLEDRTEEVMLNQPYFKHPQTKRPVAVPPTAEGQPAMMAPPSEIKHLDLRKGVYTVAVTIGKASNTLRQESQEMIGDILAKAPNLLPIIGPDYFERSDFPGHEDVAEKLRKWRDMQFPNVFNEDKDQQGPTPQQGQQMQMQIKQMGQQMQAMQQEIQTKAAEQQAKIEVAKIDSETKIKVAEIQAGAQLAAKGLEAKLDLLLDMAGAKHQEMEHRETMAHEVALMGAEQVQAQAQAERQSEEARIATQQAQGHEAGMAAVEAARAQGQQMPTE